MVHIASRLSKEMSQNVEDVRIKQPIPEAAIDITANLSNGITQKRKRQRMSPATLMFFAKHVCNSIHFGNLAVSFAQKAETRDFPVAKLQVHANAARAVKSAKRLRGCIFLPLKPQ